MSDVKFTNPQQEVVYLDVSGTKFRMSMDNVYRYPQSLLAKLVDAFKEMVVHGQEIFIDRDPKTFEWIREIHRNGDYSTTVPMMSRKALRKELDFFQLPKPEALGLNFHNLRIADKQSRCRKLLDEMLVEIDYWKAKEWLEWVCCIYFNVLDGVVQETRRIHLFAPVKIGPSGRSCLRLECRESSDSTRNHCDRFDLFLQSQGANGTDYKHDSDFSFIEDQQIVVKRISDELLSCIQSEAERMGWRISRHDIPNVAANKNCLLHITYA